MTLFDRADRGYLRPMDTTSPAPLDLDALAAASAVEREHAALAGADCFCSRCILARAKMAIAMPEILRVLRQARTATITCGVCGGTARRSEKNDSTYWCGEGPDAHCTVSARAPETAR